MVKLFSLSLVAAALTCVAAHPGEHHDHEQIKREVIERDNLAARAAVSLGKCATSVKARELTQSAIARRAATAERLRQERGIERTSYLHRRDLAALKEFETVQHNLTGSMSSNDDLFAANTSCILTPEDVVGPYYVSGEIVRSDVTDGQKGVALHLEMQLIDVDTCEPIPDLLVDVWAANATGVYSGVSAVGEGGLQTTFLRGLQQSSSEGVVEFDTIFPGHYEGRATHEHIMVHANATLLSNGSYSGGTVQHIGQLFFDETLRSAVELTSPYNTNTQEVVLNDDDQWAPTQADNSYDPFPQYIYLGDTVSDGLLMWISVGISRSANYDDDASAAAYLAADGGHATNNGAGNGAGGGAPGGQGNFTGSPSGGPGAGGNGTFLGSSSAARTTTAAATSTSGTPAASTTPGSTSVVQSSGAGAVRAFWNIWI